MVVMDADLAKIFLKHFKRQKNTNLALISFAVFTYVYMVTNEKEIKKLKSEIEELKASKGD